MSSICHAILVRKITCYDQAFEYVKAQSLDVTKSVCIQDKPPPAIKVTKKFCDNADIARRALRFYRTPAIQPIYCRTSGPIGVTEAQRTGFLKAWYRLHTLASSPPDPRPYSMLASMDPVESLQMLRIFWWLVYSCPGHHRSAQRINSQHGHLEGRLRYSGLRDPWTGLEERLACLYQDLRRFSFDEGCLEQGRQSIVQDHLLVIKELGESINTRKLRRSSFDKGCLKNGWQSIVQNHPLYIKELGKSINTGKLRRSSLDKGSLIQGREQSIVHNPLLYIKELRERISPGKLPSKNVERHDLDHTPRRSSRRPVRRHVVSAKQTRLAGQHSFLASGANHMANSLRHTPPIDSTETGWPGGGYAMTQREGSFSGTAVF